MIGISISVSKLNLTRQSYESPACLNRGKNHRIGNARINGCRQPDFALMSGKYYSLHSSSDDDKCPSLSLSLFINRRY